MLILTACADLLFFPDICELSHLFIQSTDTFLGGCLKPGWLHFYIPLGPDNIVLVWWHWDSCTGTEARISRSKSPKEGKKHTYCLLNWPQQRLSEISPFYSLAHPIQLQRFKSQPQTTYLPLITWLLNDNFLFICMNSCFSLALDVIMLCPLQGWSQEKGVRSIGVGVTNNVNAENWL